MREHNSLIQYMAGRELLALYMYWTYMCTSDKVHNSSTWIKNILCQNDGHVVMANATKAYEQDFAGTVFI